MKIASLEDDAAQADLIRLVLQADGHSCESFSEGAALMRALRKEKFDLLVLDWQLPDISGYEVVKWVRRSVDKHVPILFLTSRSLEEDIVSGLVAGADDYMIKPIRRGELSARVRALLRRASSSPAADPVLTIGKYVVMPQARRILRDGVEIELTHKEMDLALLLFSSEGQVISRDYIIEAIWGRFVAGNSRTLDTHLSRVRTKLALGPENGVRLWPVYTHGYRLEQLHEEAV
ncbi:response regulator transcription factor [Ralstonia sp. 25C]|uniref:response regulator transcription factor n=1 Tax=Ralstonia sp. 25C TaxID=3447363 RepID=UPI003F751D49